MTTDTLDPDLMSRFPPNATVGTLEFNRIAAANSMIDFFAKKDPSCVDRYFKTPYTNHNMMAPDGIAPVHHLAKWAVEWDGVHVIVRRALAEGDLVVLHSLYSNLVGIKGQRAAFDIFRFHEGMIVEHWDCLELSVAPDESGLSQIAGSVDIRDPGDGDKNRAIVLDFIETVVVPNTADASGTFIDPANFVEHQPAREPGLVRTAGIFTGAAGAATGRYLRSHITIAEGNFVFVQGEARIGDGDDRWLEVYDLFRLEAGRIVEHWDILQPLAPKDKWANQNGPFGISATPPRDI